MARGWAAIGVLACAGCRDVLGFDDLADQADIHFHLTRSNLENDADGLPITIAQRPSLDGVDVRLADGSEPALAFDADGAVQFRAPIGARYHILLSTGDGDFEIQTAAKEPSYDEIIYQRADAKATPSNTRIEYSPVAEGGGYAATGTGAWTGTDFITADATGVAVFDWTRSHPFAAGSPPLLSGNDRLYLLKFNAEIVSGVQVNHIVQAQVDDVDIPAASVLPIAGHLEPVVDHLTSVSADIPAIRNACEAAGFENATLDATAVIAFAVPTLARPDRGFLLSFASPGLAGQPLSFAMPIPDQVYPYPTTLLLDVAFSRKANTAVGTESLGCELASYTQLPANATSIELPHDIGFAASFVIDGFPLEDDIAVPISADRAVSVRWTTLGAAELFIVLLRDLDTDTLVRVYVTDAPALDVDPLLLDTTHRYALTISSRRGSEDITALFMPFTQSTVTTPPFRPVL